MTAPYITELDVVDAEMTAALAWVRCEDCDEPGEAIDMRRQYDGAWLCYYCDRRQQFEYEDQRQFLARNYPYGY